MKSKLYWAKKGQTISFGNISWTENQEEKKITKRKFLLSLHPAYRSTINIEENITENQISVRKAKKILKNEVINIQQSRWTNYNRGNGISHSKYKQMVKLTL